MAHRATEGKDRDEVKPVLVLPLCTELSLHLSSGGLSSQLLADVSHDEQGARHEEQKAGVFLISNPRPKSGCSAVKAN